MVMLISSKLSKFVAVVMLFTASMICLPSKKLLCIRHGVMGNLCLGSYISLNQIPYRVLITGFVCRPEKEIVDSPTVKLLAKL